MVRGCEGFLVRRSLERDRETETERERRGDVKQRGKTDWNLYLILPFASLSLLHSHSLSTLLECTLKRHSFKYNLEVWCVVSNLSGCRTDLFSPSPSPPSLLFYYCTFSLPLFLIFLNSLCTLSSSRIYILSE